MEKTNKPGGDAVLMRTADAVESYAEAHLFDASGLMRSSIDARTDAPFPKDFITAENAPRRALFDPWSYWTYEDTIMTAGHYIDGLVLKYEVTGERGLLERAHRVWEGCRDVYFQSQTCSGRGSFLRPYGGFDEMGKFGEPLGTDQAAPLLLGVWRLMKHAAGEDRDEMARVMLQTLEWYADQNYTYRYYRSYTVPWNSHTIHGASYYLPAIAFAYRETGDSRWEKDLHRYLARQLRDPAFGAHARGLWWGFKQGGLLELQELLGPCFGDYFTPEILARMHREVNAELQAYSEPGTTRRQHPESAADGFRPFLRPEFSRDTGLGYPPLAWVHAGHVRPRHECCVLASLAGLGNSVAGEEASRILRLRQKVPEDFTHYLVDDYDRLPAACHLYGRSVGAVMLDWWRNARLLLWSNHRSEK